MTISSACSGTCTHGLMLLLLLLLLFCLLCSLVHIELAAVDLSWDIIVRFGTDPTYQLPKAFYDDFVQVRPTHSCVIWYTGAAQLCGTHNQQIYGCRALCIGKLLLKAAGATHVKMSSPHHAVPLVLPLCPCRLLLTRHPTSVC